LATKALRGLPTLLVGLLVVSVLFTAYTAQQAWGQGQPADKIAVSGSDVDQVGDDTPIIEEQMKVSSPADLILSVTAECSILTELVTNNDQPSSDAFGSVRLRVTIDGTEVPVAADESAASEDDANDDDNEVGEVTFCNRAYHRDVTDEEDPEDGIDQEHDYIDTRTANAFNWIALDTGTNYDDPANGNNILDIVVYADYDTETSSDTNIAEAFVGSRTLVIEPGHFANNEVVAPVESPRGK
jgi:hypothetical protein